MVKETRSDARRRLTAAFDAAGIESADIDARLLVCAAASIDHAGLIRDPNMLLDPSTSERLAGFADRRLLREPVSRILGRREFWGLSFVVSPAVLDPRPDTEGLVGSVLDVIGGRREVPFSILDLGIGSAAILGALLMELPHAHGFGIDQSETACGVARANLAHLGLSSRSAIACGDWAAAIRGRFDIVVSNPPYIATGDLAGLARDVRAYDPLQALDGGVDGLDAYRAIASILSDLLKPAGVAAFECGAGQGTTVCEMMRTAGLADALVYRDLAGQDRIVLGSAC